MAAVNVYTEKRHVLNSDARWIIQTGEYGNKAFYDMYEVLMSQYFCREILIVL